MTVLPSWENRYHKLWEASKTIDSLEIHLNSGAIFSLMIADISTGYLRRFLVGKLVGLMIHAQLWIQYWNFDGLSRTMLCHIWIY